MKPLTNSPDDFELFRVVAYGHVASSLVWAGIELNLFTALKREPGQSRQALAGRLGVGDQPLRILLTGLTALGLLVKRGEAYECAPLAAELLDADSPDSYIPILAWQHHIVYRGLFHFADAVRAGANVGVKEFPGPGATIYERLSEHPALEGVFHRAMSALSARSHRNLVEGFDWGRYRSVVDFGGGDGTNLIALLGRYPGLRGTVFDIPSVCALADRKIAAAGLAGRLDTRSGDFLADPFPAADCYLFAHIFTIYSPEENLALLKKSYASLPPGGGVVVYNMMGNDDETGPMSAALGSPYFLAIATGKGMLYPSKEYEGWMRAAGFARVERLALPLDHFAIIGTK
ncbi:MAG TPA: methyltransferase [Polyangiaceae bacterium]|nr:methyltransferase [Polyangiaceae bacterium]